MSTESQVNEPDTQTKKGGRPRKDRNDNVPLQEAFELSIKRGLVSTNAAVQTQALKNAGDLLTPALGELRAEISELKRKLTAAEEALPAVVAERDTLAAKVAELEPTALRLPAIEAELAELKASFDARLSEARTELVADAQKKLWDAQRAEHAAKDTLTEAQAKFGRAGLQLLLDEVKKIVEQHSIPEPAPETLPNGISPLILTAWGHRPVRATYMLTYAKSFPEPSEDFKQTLFRVLRAGLPQHEGMSQSDPIPDLAVKREVLTAMARSWNVLDEVQRRVDDEAVQRQAEFLRNHYAQMHAAEQDAALRGEGRSPIGEVEPVSITGYTGPHPTECACPKCNGVPAHLRQFEIEEKF